MNRIENPKALRLAHSLYDECAACGAPKDSIHHLVQKGSPHHGDDVVENMIGICGHGTAGCHGAYHGSPYVVRTFLLEEERRDTEWVSRRIGKHLEAHRPDAIAYILGKLGEDAGRAFLLRFYYLEVE